MKTESKYETVAPARWIFRGEIFMAYLEDLDQECEDPKLKKAKKTETKKTRPVVVIANNLANKNDKNPNVIVACISSSPKKIAKYKRKPSPTQMLIELGSESVIMCEVIRTISKARLETKMGELTSEQIIQLDDRLKKSLGLVWI